MNFIKSKKFLAFFTFILIFIAVVAILHGFTFKSKVIVGGKTYTVEVVETKYLLEKGLSGHKPLLASEGMFFVFQTPQKYGFWMKDMTFPIDIIWLDQNFKISHIENNVKPETYPKVFYPETDSKYVLELQAGQSEISNFKIGDFVQFITKDSKNS
jgi:uncharacterized membrane protein (UPF0127 family)